MISRQHRFHGYNALNFVYRKGRGVRNEYLSLRFAPSRGKDYRLAVVVSKKISKSAVVRNRIRRRIYEAVRLYKKESGQPWPQDMIISVFEDQPAKVPSDELTATVRRLLKKSGL
ncbi:MAG: ribonuclease P protein component [Candidatus Saccharimonadales bacterium]